jgi:hypothetical protein
MGTGWCCCCKRVLWVLRLALGTASALWPWIGTRLALFWGVEGRDRKGIFCASSCARKFIYLASYWPWLFLFLKRRDTVSKSLWIFHSSLAKKPKKWKHWLCWYWNSWCLTWVFLVYCSSLAYSLHLLFLSPGFDSGNLQLHQWVEVLTEMPRLEFLMSAMSFLFS